MAGGVFSKLKSSVLRKLKGGAKGSVSVNANPSIKKTLPVFRVLVCKNASSNSNFSIIFCKRDNDCWVPIDVVPVQESTQFRVCGNIGISLLGYKIYLEDMRSGFMCGRVAVGVVNSLGQRVFIVRSYSVYDGQISFKDGGNSGILRKNMIARFVRVVDNILNLFIGSGAMVCAIAVSVVCTALSAVLTGVGGVFILLQRASGGYREYDSDGIGIVWDEGYVATSKAMWYYACDSVIGFIGGVISYFGAAHGYCGRFCDRARSVSLIDSVVRRVVGECKSVDDACCGRELSVMEFARLCEGTMLTKSVNDQHKDPDGSQRRFDCDRQRASVSDKSRFDYDRCGVSPKPSQNSSRYDYYSKNPDNRISDFDICDVGVGGSGVSSNTSKHNRNYVGGR